MDRRISVVIPTLNASAEIARTLAALEPARRSGLVRDIIVCDGGSSDATVATARRRGCIVVAAERGRGVQLRRGAEAATGRWLLFLHADTRLDAGWAEAAEGFIRSDKAEARAAVFRFALDSPSPQARRLERIVAARVAALGLPYGDQGLVISRRFYDVLGGFRPLPLMEDVDLIRRIGRERIAVLDARAVTSAARYERDGYIARTARNATCLTLYFLGVPPRRIATLYG